MMSATRTKHQTRHLASVLIHCSALYFRSIAPDIDLDLCGRAKYHSASVEKICQLTDDNRQRMGKPLPAIDNVSSSDVIGFSTEWLMLKVLGECLEFI